ncbi:MAG TPA: 3'-5' exonuclease [Pseudomonas sp.]|nr:3'-5' exonuclease [Pseudomonas sp.]
MNSHRLEATATARRWLEQNALFLDTETSGLHAGAEIVEITLIDSSGEAVLDTLVRPERPIPPALTRIHGIDNRMVADAPRWPQLHERLLDIIEGRPVVIYNADFDLRMLTQVAHRHALPWPEVVRRHAGWTRLENDTVIHCAMREYAKFHGEWDERRGDWRWQKLGNAARQQGIAASGAHRALADCRMMLAVIRAIAEGAQPHRDR